MLALELEFEFALDFELVIPQNRNVCSAKLNLLRGRLPLNAVKPQSET